MYSPLHYESNDRRTPRRAHVLRRCWMKKIFQGERGSEPEADLTRANSRNVRKLSPTLYRIGVDRRDSNTILPAVSSWRASEGQTDQPPSSPWRICRRNCFCNRATNPWSLNYLKAANEPDRCPMCCPLCAPSAFGRTNVHRTGRTFAEISEDQTRTGEPDLPLLERTEDAFDVDHSIRPRTGTGIWHPWRVIIPRRSIYGEFIWGRVWRRTNGEYWIYRKSDPFH
jgi:hypothetical protein